MKQNCLIFLVILMCSCRYDLGGNYEHLQAFDVRKPLSDSMYRVCDIATPDGYVRSDSEVDSWAEFLQSLPLREDTVYCYDGSVSDRVDKSYAVVDIEIGTEDLQQCADAVIRMRSEYLYREKRYGEIHYNFSNGFNCSYERYAQGERVCVLLGRFTFWAGSKPIDYSYPTFRRYLDQVYRYAGTASLIKELDSVDVNDIQIGDVLIRGGYPGHAMLVVDVAIDPTTADKVIMLAQGFTPAQNIHIVKTEDQQPWFRIKDYIEGDSLNFLFNIKQVKRFKDA